MKRFWIFLPLISFIPFFILSASLCNAHRPHDAIFSLAVSPEYSIDGEIYVTVDHYLLHVLKTNTKGVSWRPFQTGIGIGMITALAYSPNYKNDRTVFVVTTEGKFYQSIDEGTWQLVSEIVGAQVSSIAPSPSYGQDKTIFVGTSGYGVFKSTDGGVTWINKNYGFSNLNINHLAISHSYLQDQIIFAGSQGGIFKSIDGGNAWLPMGGQSSINVTSISLSPDYSNDSLIFASTYGYGIFKSADGGQNWTAINNGITDLIVKSIAISPNYSNDRTIIAVSKDTGVFKSTDEGSSWELFDQGLKGRTDQSDNHFFSSSFSPDYKNDQAIFVAMFEGLFKSEDEGNSWHQLNVYQPELTRSVGISPDFLYDNQVIYGTYGAGTYLSSDGGSTWEIRNAGMDNPWIFSLLYGPDNNVFAVTGGTHHGTFYRSDDDGVTWDKTIIDADEIFQPSIKSIALSPNFLNDKIIFVGSRYYGKYALYKSTDGGQSFRPISITVRDVYPITFSPYYSVDNTVFVGTEKGIYKSIDQGENWLLIGLANTFIFSLEISNDNSLFAGSVLEGIFKSTDGGTSWLPVNDGLPELSIMDVEMSPNYENDQTIFIATLNNGIYKSNDSGASWQYSGLFGNYIQVLKASPGYETDQTLFAGTWDGVLKSVDGGENWELISTVVRYEENFDSFVVSGDWSRMKCKVCSCSFIAYSETTGSEVTFTFVGKMLRWMGSKGPDHGVANIYVDDEYQGPIDLYSDQLLLRQNIYTTADLPSGIHKIRIEVGTHIPQNGKIVSVDAIDVLR